MSPPPTLGDRDIHPVPLLCACSQGSAKQNSQEFKEKGRLTNTCAGVKQKRNTAHHPAALPGQQVSQFQARAPPMQWGQLPTRLTSTSGAGRLWGEDVIQMLWGCVLRSLAQESVSPDWHGPEAIASAHFFWRHRLNHHGPNEPTLFGKDTEHVLAFPHSNVYQQKMIRIPMYSVPKYIHQTKENNCLSSFRSVLTSSP